MDFNKEEFINEKFDDDAGKAMIHLAKFKYRPQYQSHDWIVSSYQGSKQFTNAWDNASNRTKYKGEDNMNAFLDKSYEKARRDELNHHHNLDGVPRPDQKNLHLSF